MFSDRSHAPNDGGAKALMGYLYQFIGTASIQVSKGYTNIADAGDLTLQIETLGQDVVAGSRNEIELIQFKFSGTKDAISPGEYANIIRALQASEKQIGKGILNVEWKLISNRDLSNQTIKLCGGLELSRRGRTSAADAKLIRNEGRRCKYLKHSINHFDFQLEQRIKAFGESNVSSARQRVNGYLLSLIERPEGSRVIDKEALDKELAGYSRPRLLRPNEFKQFAKDDLTRILGDLDTPIVDIMPRRAISELLATPELAIALVTGHGGL